MTQSNPAPPDAVSEFRAPSRAAEVGVWFGTIAVGLMFAAGLTGYVIMRRRSGVEISVPMIFWFSTALIFISSPLIYAALQWARQSRQLAVERALLGTAVLGAAFLALQLPGLQQIAASHRAALQTSVGLYGITLVLIGLHALHVLGGVVALCVVYLRATRLSVVADIISPLRTISVYWHGLAVVWLMMFSVLLLTR